MNQIHEKTLAAAVRFRRAEAELVSVLQEVESERVFLKMGYTSLFSYCVQALGLSERVTANFVTVARKAREIPALQSAIQSGALSVSKARKITPVLTLATQRKEESPVSWIDLHHIRPRSAGGPNLWVTSSPSARLITEWCIRPGGFDRRRNFWHGSRNPLRQGRGTS